VEPTIHLDRKRTMRYGSRALRLVEERSGHILGELLITHASAASATWLLWGALLHEDEAFRQRLEPKLSIDDVCDLLDEYWFGRGKTLKDLAPMFAEAVVQAGMFSREGKASPETGSGSPGSGKDGSEPSASATGSTA